MPNPAHAPSWRLVCSLIAFAAFVVVLASGRALARDLDVPYVPTPQAVVDKMLELAGIKSGDVLLDLGSGDGRIPITAAKKYGITASGVDLNPVRVKEAKENAEKEGVTDKVQFHEQNLFETDLSKATVITMYLLSEVNMKLRPKLEKLKPGTRIVSHAFDLGDWKPDKSEVVDGRNVYFWVVRENMIRETNAGKAAD
ncbi:methyltransferase domain-containing protein [Hyphomicrobium sp. CS1GBMeth3]|uniref:SAM-dependent methyltransferase n=1 Tax=Hyphomicrobium sp. CS1GBMeth3 TaxID=1892845 RepID=UPI00092FE20A|nr:methyltransferase domain-containing protein [Hyphomicrobium sp. CS1GBMeth3]